MPAATLPHVDVFLCTYNEDLEILEGPILAARNMDYPNFTVWVLDDGRRAWLRDFCAAHGVRYLTRPNNAHAKAGNINHALSKTDAELFAVLDADFTPRRDFLMRTVGFFEDPTIAIVQTPHHFRNSDIYQMNLGMGEQWPDEQRLFFDIVQPSRDAWDCAFCCGSASVQRRSALMDIGGIPTDSVTEDILSTLVLLRQGYVTRFLNEPLAFGLSSESVAAMFVQRQRWCRGGLQLLFLRDGVLGPGLTLDPALALLPDRLAGTNARAAIRCCGSDHLSVDGCGANSARRFAGSYQLPNPRAHRAYGGDDLAVGRAIPAVPIDGVLAAFELSVGADHRGDPDQALWRTLPGHAQRKRSRAGGGSLEPGLCHVLAPAHDHRLAVECATRDTINRQSGLSGGGPSLLGAQCRGAGAGDSGGSRPEPAALGRAVSDRRTCDL